MKKTVSILLTIAMLAVMIPTLAVSAAAPTAWDGAAYDLSWATQLVTSSGETADVTIDNVEYTTIEPSATEPFILEDAADLAGLAKLVNGKQNSDKGILTDCTFYITNDIDLGSKNWTPIGNTFNNRFGGNLIGSKGDQTGNGGAVTINNLVIYNDTATTAAAFGLVGTQQGGSIKNISLTNAKLTTVNFRIGSFVGQANAMTLENLSSDAEIMITAPKTDNSWDVAGGIAGCAYGGITVAKCVFTGTITNGIKADGTKVDGGEVCGGIIGNVQNAATITNCVVVSDCIQVVNTTTEGASYGCGGIVGVIRNNQAQNITNCYVSANLKGEKGRVGGFVAHTWSGCTTVIENCQFDGIISASATQGAFVGYIQGATTINNCLNTGVSSLNADFASKNAFMAVGSGTIQSSSKTNYSIYTLKDISSKSISEMDMNTTVSSTDTTKLWTQRDGTMYPVLTLAKDIAPTYYAKSDVSWFDPANKTTAATIDSYSDILGLARILASVSDDTNFLSTYNVTLNREAGLYISALFDATTASMLMSKLNYESDTDNVIFTKAQTSTVHAADGTYSVRVVSEIKGMEWDSAGFEFVLSYTNSNGNIVSSKISSVSIDKCYTSLLATDADSTSAITPTEEGNCFVVFVFSDIPSAIGNATVSAVVSLTEGNATSYGTVASFTFDQNGNYIAE